MLALAMSRLLVEEIDYGDPLPVFARFARLPGAVFLDSAVTSATVGRYSFIVAEPFLTLRSRDGQIDDGELVANYHKWFLGPTPTGENIRS